MKSILTALGVCLLTGLLSSCSMVSANTEDLLEPPQLSPDQAALAEALERGLGTDDFTLKYPISGENRSAYLLCDLDNEPSNEAVVFYQLTGNDTIRMNILDQNERGEWESVYDMAGAGDDIYTVDLASLSSLDRNDLIISWKDRGRTELDIEIYSYETGTLSNLFSGSGDRIYFMDINEDGYSEMVLLGWASSRDPSLQIVRRAGSRRHRLHRPDPGQNPGRGDCHLCGRADQLLLCRHRHRGAERLQYGCGHSGGTQRGG